MIIPAIKVSYDAYYKEMVMLEQSIYYINAMSDLRILRGCKYNLKWGVDAKRNQ